jgi:hypothetical protein
LGRRQEAAQNTAVVLLPKAMRASRACVRVVIAVRYVPYTRTVVGEEDEAAGRHIQAANREEPGRQPLLNTHMGSRSGEERSGGRDVRWRR